MIARLLVFVCLFAMATLTPVGADDEHPPISRLDVCNKLAEPIDVATDYGYRDGAGKLQFPQQGWTPVGAGKCQRLTFDPPVDGKDGDVYFAAHATRTNRLLHLKSPKLDLCGRYPESFRQDTLVANCPAPLRKMTYYLPTAQQFDFEDDKTGRVTFRDADFTGNGLFALMVLNNTDAAIRRMRITSKMLNLSFPEIGAGMVYYVSYKRPLVPHCLAKISVDLTNGTHLEQPEDVCEAPFIGISNSSVLGWPWPFLAIMASVTPTPVDTPKPTARPDRTVSRFLAEDCIYNSFARCAKEITGDVGEWQIAFCDTEVSTERRANDVVDWLSEREYDTDSDGRKIADEQLSVGIHTAMSALAPGC